MGPQDRENELNRHPHDGEMPSDVGVQAERQEEGLEGEYESEGTEEVREQHRQ